MADAAVERLGARPAGATAAAFEVDGPLDRQPAISLTLDLTTPSTAAPTSRSPPTGEIDIPFFGWFFRPLVARSRTAATRAHAIATLRAALGRRARAPAGRTGGRPAACRVQPRAGRPSSRPRRPPPRSCRSRPRSSVSCPSPISHSFGASTRRIGDALAITRLGALFALFAIAVADRRGRRRSILIGVVGSAIACALSAVAPNLVAFTTVAGAPARARRHDRAPLRSSPSSRRRPKVPARTRRRCSRSPVDSASRSRSSRSPSPTSRRGAGGCPFALGGATILLAPVVARSLGETDALHRARGADRRRARSGARRVRPPPASIPAAGRRRVPHERLQRAVVAVHEPVPHRRTRVHEHRHRGLPHDHHRDPRARRGRARAAGWPRPAGGSPVAAIALAVATGLADDLLPERRRRRCGSPSAVSIFMAGAGGIALGTLDAELFPTEVRSTSNAMLYVVGGARFGDRARTRGRPLAPPRRPRAFGRAHRHRLVPRRAARRPAAPGVGRPRILDDVSPTQRDSRPG